jgi:general secretion pathway protein E
VEDPIEMIEPSFNQTQVQPQLGFGFPEGLRALMRQDPDIIMVGEIRDLATAEMAVQAALTGHLVFSTLHTNDAPSAITRLLESLESDPKAGNASADADALLARLREAGVEPV